MTYSPKVFSPTFLWLLSLRDSTDVQNEEGKKSTAVKEHLFGFSLHITSVMATFA